MKTMNHIAKAIGVWSIMSLACGVSQAVNYAPVANLTERWIAGDAQWSKVGTAAGVWTNQSLGVLFTKYEGLSIPMARYHLLFADNIASGGRFIGNYVSNHIDAVSFDIKQNAFVGSVTFYLTANGHQWSYHLQLPQADGETATLRVPLKPSSNWISDPESLPREAIMSDLVDVTQIGVLASEDGIAGTPNNLVAIDNFKLVGPWAGPFTPDGISQNWIQENSIPLAQSDASDDPDHDGFSNYQEFMAGTDPNDATSFLKLDIRVNESGLPVLRWKNAPYKSYNILRSHDLASDSPFELQVQGLQSDADQSEVVVDNEGRGAHFYKIEVQ